MYDLLVYRCATRIEKGREACKESPTIEEEWIKTEIGKKVCGGEYDEEVVKEKVNGVTHMVRNVTAHELKIKWIVNEQDAIDILTTISFLHKQLDECFVVPQHII